MDIGGNGGSSFPFHNPGDTVVGKILSIDEVQQTDPKTGAPQFWDEYKTQPKMQYRVTLQTDLRDQPDDDGHRAVYLKGSRKPETKSSLSATLEAVKQATGGSTDLREGGYLRLTYVGDGAKTNAALSAPKLYEAQYQAPQVNLGQPAPASQPSAPAPQQYVSQQPYTTQPLYTPPQPAQQYAQPSAQPPF